MNLLQEAKDILEITTDLKEKRINRKNIRSDSRKWSIRESNISFTDQTPNPQRKASTHIQEKHFRITYLRTVIPYLDLSSILNVGVLNREFNQFIFSIYFYKFITEMRLYQQKHKKSHNEKSHSASSAKDDKSSKGAQSGLFSKLTGALSYFAGTNETPTKKDYDQRDIVDKLNLHEKILLEKQKQFTISKEIREIRDVINRLVDERYAFQMNKNAQSQASQSIRTELTDEEIEKIKKEKLERESNRLYKEVEKLRKESEELKGEVEILQKEDISNEMLMNSISSYVKNKMNYEEIKEDLSKRDSYTLINYNETDNNH